MLTYKLDRRFRLIIRKSLAESIALIRICIILTYLKKLDYMLLY